MKNKVEFGKLAKQLAVDILLDRCEGIAKTTTDLSERVQLAYNFLTSLVPVNGIIDVSARDYFGFGLIVGGYFGALDVKEGENNES